MPHWLKVLVGRARGTEPPPQPFEITARGRRVILIVGAVMVVGLVVYAAFTGDFSVLQVLIPAAFLVVLAVCFRLVTFARHRRRGDESPP
ncbi:MAG: hypothetical protein ACJ71T_01370 [Actinomycetales bacterium]